MSAPDPIGALEDAILARLRTAFTAGGRSVLKRIEALERPFEANVPASTQIHPPAIYLAPLVAKPTGTERHLEMHWAAYCVSGSATPETRARGASGAFGIGTYAIAGRVVASLDGWLPDVPEASGLSILGVENFTGLVLVKERMAVFAVTFAGRIECLEALGGSGLDDFLTYHSDWDIAPHAAPPEALPVAEPDATNTVTLEGASG